MCSGCWVLHLCHNECKKMKSDENKMNMPKREESDSKESDKLGNDIQRMLELLCIAR